MWPMAALQPLSSFLSGHSLAALRGIQRSGMASTPCMQRPQFSPSHAQMVDGLGRVVQVWFGVLRNELLNGCLDSF